jgi:glycosyltransferase involved in cell wall biosynthesis
MKRVLYLIGFDLRGGSTICALELIKKIQQTEFKPTVVTLYKNDFNDFCTKNNIENYSCHFGRICSMSKGFFGRSIAFFMRPILNYVAFKYLKQKINFSEINFVHSNDTCIDFGAYLHKKLGVLHFWHVRDFFLFDGKWPPLVKNLPCYMSKNATKIITVSKALENYLINNGCPQNKVQTIYDGVAVPFNGPKRFCSEIKKDVLNVACVGQLCRLKGQMTLVDAISKMTEDERRHFRIVFFGEIKHDIKEELAKKMKELELKQSIEFKGFSKNILSDLTGFDVGVQPSHSEGFSRVTAEYMAAGLCVIAAEEGAIPELIQHNENGLLYEDYNSQELKKHLLFCYQNQSQMYALAKKAQQKFFSHYDIEINFSHILEQYNQIVAKN